jgi:hypothetical protein
VRIRCLAPTIHGRPQEIVLISKIQEDSGSEMGGLGWRHRQVPKPLESAVYNADGALHTYLHKMIVADENLKCDVVGIAEIHPGRTGWILSVVDA